MSPNATLIDRIPPHSIDAEKAVIGCILMDPKCIDICITKLRAGADVFYDLRHRELYEAMLDVHDAGQPRDLIAFKELLTMRGQLESVGGLAYLVECQSAVPSAANLDYYADVVLDKYHLRQIIKTCSELIARVYEHAGDVPEFLDQAEKQFMTINSERAADVVEPMKTIVHRAIDTIEQYHSRQGMVRGVATGYIDFDKMTGGLQPAEMSIIAARPSMGKTSLAMNIAEHVAVDSGKPVGVFSLEMSKDSLVIRTLCSRARVNLRNVRDGFLAERDFPKLTSSAGKLCAAPIYIDDSSSLSVTEFRAKARRMVALFNVELFVIDYLQLLHSVSKRVHNREQEIADISKGIKASAKELNLPIIVLSQLNRTADKEDRAPRLSDLRESGAIEQDADLVAFLYNAPDDDDRPHRNGDSEAIPVKLAIAKQRNGPTGAIDLTFIKAYTRFESAAKIGSPEPEPENSFRFGHVHNDP